MVFCQFLKKCSCYPKLAQIPRIIEVLQLTPQPSNNHDDCTDDSELVSSLMICEEDHSIQNNNETSKQSYNETYIPVQEKQFSNVQNVQSIHSPESSFVSTKSKSLPIQKREAIEVDSSWINAPKKQEFHSKENTSLNTLSTNWKSSKLSQENFQSTIDVSVGDTNQLCFYADQEQNTGDEFYENEDYECKDKVSNQYKIDVDNYRNQFQNGPSRFHECWDDIIMAVTEQDEDTIFQMSQQDHEIVRVVAQGMMEGNMLPEEHHIASMFFQILASKCFSLPPIINQFIHDEVIEYMKLILGANSPMPTARLQICKALSLVSFGGKSNELRYELAREATMKFRTQGLLKGIIDLFARINIKDKKKKTEECEEATSENRNLLITLIEILRNFAFLSGISADFVISNFTQQHYSQICRVFQYANNEERKCILQLTFTIGGYCEYKETEVHYQTFFEGLINASFPIVLLQGAQTGDEDLFPRAVNQMRMFSQCSKEFAENLILNGAVEVLLLVITAMLSFAGPQRAREYTINYDMNQGPNVAALKLAPQNQKSKIVWANVCAACINQISMTAQQDFDELKLLECLLSDKLEKQEYGCLYLSLAGTQLTDFKKIKPKGAQRQTDQTKTVVSALSKILSSSQKWYVQCAILRVIYEWLVPESTDSQARGFTTELKQLIVEPIIRLLKKQRYANPGLHLMVLWSATFLVFNEPMIVLRMEKEGVYKMMLDTLVSGKGLAASQDNKDDYYQAACTIVGNMLFNNQQKLGAGDVSRVAKAMCELMDRSKRLDCPRTVCQALHNIVFMNATNTVKVRDCGAVASIVRIIKYRIGGMEQGVKLLWQMCLNDQSGKTQKQIANQPGFVEQFDQLMEAYPNSGFRKSVQRLKTVLETAQKSKK
eukprot:TRINITY_DN66215_c0_g1_i2.p1 TRINITY_DN66215_c0_g1~~TRINITY_DN66215_c0_g1_i2.p1  ORF type:complete len:890 (-),score=107.73 TRINITY_DN66215_c0_g1_i2:218-2887(-)